MRNFYLDIKQNKVYAFNPETRKLLAGTNIEHQKYLDANVIRITSSDAKRGFNLKKFKFTLVALEAMDLPAYQINLYTQPQIKINPAAIA